MPSLPLPLEDYPLWLKTYEPEFPRDNARILDALGGLAYRPSLLLVVIGTGSTTCGVHQNQLYDKIIFEPFEEAPSRTDLGRLLVETKGDLVFALPSSAILPPHALAEFVFAAHGRPDCDVFFADEDTYRNGIHCDPVFKTSFDPILAVGRDSIGIPVAFRTSRLIRLLETSNDRQIFSVENLIYDLALQIIAEGSADRICHIPAVLAHNTAPGSWSAERARSALQSHIVSTPGQVAACVDHPQWSRIIFAVPPSRHKVSCIIPTRDQPVHLRRTLGGLLQETDYDSLEVIILDNGSKDAEALSILAEAAADSRVRVLVDDRKFNYSRLNNLGAAQATGDIFVLLNNDMEIVDRDWLRLLAGYATQPGFGAVGARLLYPNGTIQHAGIAIGPDYEIEHTHRFEHGRGDALPPGIVLSRSVSAVTGACLALRAEVFRAMDGLDAERFPVGYNDIDLCRRIARSGLKIVYAADVVLIHHESVSRGTAPTLLSAARSLQEELDFWKKHSDAYDHADPYCSPNIVYEFARTTLSCPPRHRRPWNVLENAAGQPFLY